MRQRIIEELVLLREVHPAALHQESGGEDWFLIPGFEVTNGWQIGDAPIERCDIAFKLGAGHPTNPPYGFVAPMGINYEGAPPGNPGSPVAPPFPGEWQHFSGNPENWQPTADVRKGSNILTWLQAIRARFEEGA